MTLTDYIAKLNTLYITGNAREHSYRGDLQNLLTALLPGVLVTNEPARVECGAPDYVLTRKDVPVGYIEAKDIGIDLGSKTLKEQFDRYRSGLSNLIITDYLEFHFYKEGALTAKVTIGKLEQGRISAVPENFEHFSQLMVNFAQTVTQTIKSPTRLAEMMAGKAKLMADVIERSLDSDDDNHHESNLKKQMLSFRQMLIHDINNKAFADIYAQTIAYGMFAARYHDPTLPTFSREEAATLIPKSNPFLRKLFQDIAGYDLDDRLVWIVDELVNIFLATDVASIMKNFGKSTRQEDPVVHFYETFLASYSPALRKARGVWYTPQPVVNFIVRAVDDILKTEFGLKDGLADTSKTKIKVKGLKFDDRSKSKSKITGETVTEKEVHRVQILDPATGTGTFLAEVVRHIHKKFEGQQGIWSKYVNADLIPRLNGFELLMASYAMAHLKLDMLLTETGYKPTTDQRFKIFLTNSLEEPTEENIDLFNWLADEANQANAIKRDAPVMVVLGNPPYSVSSTNKSPWIENLVGIYKKGVTGFNKNSLSDDYVKFIRLGQYLIEKNGEGILAYISNNSFLDGITHNKMRENLLNTFDKIYVVDLHGSYKKNEKDADGKIDENVFEIQQGVSINIFIKKKVSSAKEICKIDLLGGRKYKYNYLTDNSINSILWNIIKPTKPHFFFKEFNNDGQGVYNEMLSIKQLFNSSGTGIKFRKDNLLIKPHFDEESVETMVNDLTVMEDQEILRKYQIENTTDWNISEKKIFFNLDKDAVRKVQYRPFDYRYTFYPYQTINSIIVRGDSRRELMKNLFKNNLALLVSRQQSSFDFQHCFISNTLVDMCSISAQSKETTYAFPLYLYHDTNGQLTTDGEQTRVPNLNPEIVAQIAKGLGLQFVPEKEDGKNTFAPIDLLDYIYAVLHSPAYREKYNEFLKIDFPRVPYPTDAATFRKLVALGGEIRQIHLLESPVVEKYITQYPEDGDNVVEKPGLDAVSDGKGRVYINSAQYFDNVPEVAWNFYIGGYQPAQKWLKDRKGRELSMEDIFHYQKIIVALTETDRIMKEIDTVMEV